MNLNTKGSKDAKKIPPYPPLKRGEIIYLRGIK